MQTCILLLASWGLYIDSSNPYLSRGAAYLNPYPIGNCSSHTLCLSHSVHRFNLPSKVLSALILELFAGPTALCFRLAMKLMDYNLMATITALMAPVLPDFKKAMNSKKVS